MPYTHCTTSRDTPGESRHRPHHLTCPYSDSGFAAGEGCNRADLAITATYGVGYTIPALVAKVINFFLKIFNAKPIAAHGSIPERPPLVGLVNLSRISPDLPVCKH